MGPAGIGGEFLAGPPHHLGQEMDFIPDVFRLGPEGGADLVDHHQPVLFPFQTDFSQVVGALDHPGHGGIHFRDSVGRQHQHLDELVRHFPGHHQSVVRSLGLFHGNLQIGSHGLVFPAQFFRCSVHRLEEGFFLAPGHQHHRFPIPGNGQSEGASMKGRQPEGHFFPGGQEHPDQENIGVYPAPVDVFP